MKSLTVPWILQSGALTLDCRPTRTGPAHVMGILNVTPDSFSDGGTFISAERALARADEMISEGAAIIDVGGASSRPRGSVYGAGAAPVSVEEEIRRVVPVIVAISNRHPSVWISVDTFVPEVAREALAAGAHIINDITGLRVHPELADVAASGQAPMILMHSVGTPGDMPHAVDRPDAAQAVRNSLQESLSKAQSHGVSQVVIDPGFGFGKTARDNLRLLGRLDQLKPLGHPILVGISRKSTIGTTLGSADKPAPVEERLFGSLGATAIAVMRGASIIRTHDVRPTVEMLKVMAATLGA